MPVLFPYAMALAAVDPSIPLRADGHSNWSVHCFDRMGRWTASVNKLSKAEAIKRAAKMRRRERMPASTRKEG